MGHEKYTYFIWINYFFFFSLNKKDLLSSLLK